MQRDVGIQAGRIVSVGSLDGVEAEQTLHIGGLVVAPGFIDIHSHSDATLLVDPRACSSIAQGVTTEVVGNCGHAPAPLVDPGDVPDLVFGYNPALEVELDDCRRLPAARSSTPARRSTWRRWSGHIALRLAALGRAPRPATPASSTA